MWSVAWSFCDNSVLRSVLSTSGRRHIFRSRPGKSETSKMFIYSTILARKQQRFNTAAYSQSDSMTRLQHQIRAKSDVYDSLVVAARNAVTVVLAGAVYSIFLVNDIRPFTASNQIPAGLPPFSVPDFSIYSPSENRTITTGEIFSVSRLYILLRFADSAHWHSPHTITCSTRSRVYVKRYGVRPSVSLSRLSTAAQWRHFSQTLGGSNISYSTTSPSSLL